MGTEKVTQELAHRLGAEVDRLRLALRILAGLPDDAGVTHASELSDEGDRTCYARGVLAGADPADISEAMERGSKP